MITVLMVDDDGGDEDDDGGNEDDDGDDLALLSWTSL